MMRFCERQLLVLRLLLDLLNIQSQQSNRRVLHHFRLGPNRHRENARHIDANILRRQRILQRNFNLDRLQTQIRMVLNQRPNKRRPTTASRSRPRSCRAGLREWRLHSLRDRRRERRHRSVGSWAQLYDERQRARRLGLHIPYEIWCGTWQTFFPAASEP